MLSVHLQPDHEAAADELDRLTDRLRRELLQLDVDGVWRAACGPAPYGARAVEVEALGTLLVSAFAPEVLRAVVATVRDWLGRSRARSVSLEIDGDVLQVTGLPSSVQERLIESWLARRTGS